MIKVAITRFVPTFSLFVYVFHIQFLYSYFVCLNVNISESYYVTIKKERASEMKISWRMEQKEKQNLVQRAITKTHYETVLVVASLASSSRENVSRQFSPKFHIVVLYSTSTILRKIVVNHTLASSPVWRPFFPCFLYFRDISTLRGDTTVCF